MMLFESFKKNLILRVWALPTFYATLKFGNSSMEEGWRRPKRDYNEPQEEIWMWRAHDSKNHREISVLSKWLMWHPISVRLPSVIWNFDVVEPNL